MLEEVPKLIQPQEHRAKVSIWADLTVSDMDRIEEAGTTDEIKAELANIFGLTDNKEDMKNGILIDLFYYTIRFARDHKFSKEQTSTFFTIVKRTHEICIETPFGNVDQCFNYFKEMVLCHAVKRPPFSTDLFSAEEVRKITDYVINTYFRHFKMYKYVFTPLVRLDLSMTYNGMPVTPAVSEAGDVVGESEDQGIDGTQEDQPEGEDVENAEQAPVKEESPEAKELRGLIKEHLSEELKKLKVSMDEQLKETEDTINRKIAAVEGAASGKTGRGSAKSKKK